MQTVDFVIVGGGIVGLTVAREIGQRHPGARIAIFEKEERLGVHASGRNSGVLHCGLFYGADTLKAKVCADGARAMMAYADENGIAYRKCGKVIVATDETRLPTLEKLMKNAADNGIVANRISAQELLALEPAAAPGVAAIHTPDTAVIDSNAVLAKLHEQLVARGVQFFFGTAVTAIADAKTLHTSAGAFSFGFLFNCAGAYADVIARQFDLAQGYALVPFKGIYWKLAPSANHLVRGNIYAVPDVSMPFLGVHLTRVMSGDVYIGPTSIPAFGRENYGILKGMKPAEAAVIASRMAMMYWHNQNNFRKMAHAEMAKYSKPYFFKAAQKLCPTLKPEDMVPSPKVGIRPQLVNLKTHKLEMDYILEKTENSLHVLNAISPAFTSSLAFAQMIVDKSGVAG